MHTMNQQIALLLSLLLSLPQLHAAVGKTGDLQCLDANGEPLDWFAMLKQPESAEYAYISSRSPDSWVPTSQPNLKKNGPLFATVNQLLTGPSSESPGADVLAAYNDEPPGARRAWSSSFGHMKGVVALTAGRRGLWLIHSVPKFPDLSLPEYSYPATGVKYGQSFLCITVDSDGMADAIGRQLFASHPELYRTDVSPVAASSWPSWADLKSGMPPPAKLLNSTAHLATAAGLPVLHVAKSPHLRDDLYSYLLAGQLDSSIQVETWQHGPKLLNSTCGRRYNVTKVLRLQINSAMKEFQSTADHSKWCVTTGSGSRPYVCIGDMNRANSQFRRGGGTACIQLPGPHRLFKAAVLSDQACGRDNVGYLSSREANATDTDKDKAETQLLAVLNWVMVAVFCSVACTVASLMLVLWLSLRGRGVSGVAAPHKSDKQYLVL